jgi:hypothetical protein
MGLRVTSLDSNFGSSTSESCVTVSKFPNLSMSICSFENGNNDTLQACED